MLPNDSDLGYSSGPPTFSTSRVPTPNQHFLWLSASRPIDAAATPFTPDLQAWVRNAEVDPDWLRIGTDVVGAGTFNLAFSLAGNTTDVPEPATLALFGTGLLGCGMLRRRRS